MGETMRNVQVQTAGHNDPTHNSEPARHLKQNKSHKFSWKVIYPARKFFKRKILEGLFKQQKHPSLNKTSQLLHCKAIPSGNNLSYNFKNTLAANCAQFPEDDFFSRKRLDLNFIKILAFLIMFHIYLPLLLLRNGSKQTSSYCQSLKNQIHPFWLQTKTY